MKERFLHFVLLFVVTFVVQQNYAQNPGWILTPKYVPDMLNPSFTSTLPTASSYTGDPAFGASNMQMDANGNILFFVVDEKVYDKDGEIIGSLEGTISEPFSPDYCVWGFEGSEIAIISDPVNCLKYYIISYAESQQACGGHLTGHDLIYATLDFSEQRPGNPSKMGKLSDVKFLKAPGYTWHYGDRFGVLLAASAIRSTGAGDSRYLFVNNNFFGSQQGIVRFKIDNNGINYDGNIPYPTNISSAGLRAEMELIDLPNGHFKIAVPYLTNISHNSKTVFSCVYIAELDATGQVYNNQEEILYFYKSTNSQADPYIHGLEFSPDGSKLFISHVISQYHPNSLEYYDFSNPNPSDPNGNGIYALNIGTANNADFQYSHIEYALDQKMYFGAEGRLASLNNPNNPGSNTLADNATMVSGYTANAGSWWMGIDDATKLYTLPDQIDGMDYNDLFEVNLACCIATRFYQINSFTASNGTWNGNAPIAPGQSTLYIQKEFRVPAGVVLTINNMILKFAPGARFVVENGTGGSKGGRVQLNNTTLTIDDRCSQEEMWLGVEVWGNTTVTQGATFANSTQGVFRLIGNSRIEHAMVGVLVSRRNEVNGVPVETYNSNYNGGIAIIENSHFFNCWGGMSFQSYNIGTNNLSQITNSNFVWDGLLKNPTLKPQIHIGINQCTDIAIRRSNFYQHTPNLYTNPQDRGYGIFALNSTFKVFSSCSTIMPIGYDCPDANNLPSKFENLYTGVAVLNLNNKLFTVLRNEFTNCLFGVTSIGAKEQKISRNKMYIPEIDAVQTWGIYVTTGTGYEIAENYLKGIDNPSVSLANARSYGIIIDNSGESHNEVYKNTFEELYVGTQAQNNNAKIYVPGPNNNAGGLQYICNEFKSSIYLADIGVNGRIDYEQGRIPSSSINDARKNAARNTFSMFGESHALHPDHDIMLYPGSQSIAYVHLADNAHTPDNYTINPPTEVHPHLQLWGGLPLYANSSTCPTLYPAEPKFEFEFPFDGFLLQEMNQIDSLNNIFDDGNTDKFLSLIVSQPASTNTHNELMNASPYLSDKVLESYIKSTAPDYQLKSVLIANSGLSASVQNALNNSSRSAVKRDLALYQNNVSAQQELKNQIKSANGRLYDKQRTVISAILSDSTITATSDSLVKYLELFRGTGFKKSLLSQYSIRQEQEKFDALLNGLSEKLSEQESELYKIQYTINGYVSMQEALEQRPDLIEQLQHIVQSKAESDVIKSAQSLISALKDEEIVFDVLPLRASKKEKQAITIEENSKDVKTEVLSSIEFFPNPSTGIVQFRFSELESDFASVQFLDITGKEVFSKQFSNTATEKIDVSHLKKGTYMVNVVVDGVKAKAKLLVLE